MEKTLLLAAGLYLSLFSMPLNANSIDPLGPFDRLLQGPYEVQSLRLFNVSTGLARIPWTGTTLEFTRTNARTGSIEGKLNIQVGNREWKSESFYGSLDPSSRSFRLSTVFPTTFTLFRGQFNPDFTGAWGRLDGLYRSDMTGVYALRQVSLPSSLLLFLGAVVSLPLLGLRRRRTRYRLPAML